jgi:putative endonuclease
MRECRATCPQLSGRRATVSSQRASRLEANGSRHDIAHPDASGTVSGVRTDARRALGRRGEALAAAHLRSLGFSMLARNARTRYGEIDLIAFDGRTLVFAEVKTRRVGARQRRIRADQQPLSTLGSRQRARLRRLAAAWLRAERERRPAARAIRFDAIGVVLDTDERLRGLEHLEGAW